MGLVGRVFQVVAIVFLLVVGFGAFLYFTDYAVEATLTGRGQDSEGRYVIATTKIGGYDVKQYVGSAEYASLDTRCFSALKPEDGNCFVTYTVQTKQLSIYANEGGDLIYAS